MISMNQPIEAEVELDGGYLYCPVCHQPDIELFTERCPSCHQLFDWAWLHKVRKDREQRENE